MRTAIRVAAFAAIGVGAANLAFAQGPVRQGLRRTGEAAANVTRGAAQGTANVARGVAQGTANVARGVARGTANVARGVGEAAIGTARVAGDVLTPNTPFQARAGANLGVRDQGRDARWRFARHNGEWWYYTPQNNWMYHRGEDWQQFSQDSFEPMNQGRIEDRQQLAQDQPSSQAQQYSSGYRGVEQGGGMSQDQGVHQQLRHDRQGRAYICENGRPVYVDEGQHYQQGQSQDGQMSPTSATPEEYNAERQKLDEQGANAEAQQDQSSIQANAAPATPAPPSNATGDANVSTAPAGDNTSSQVQPDAAASRETRNNPTPQTQGATESTGQ